MTPPPQPRPPPLLLLLVVGHELGRADGNVAHHAGGPRVPQEEHLGPGVLPPVVPAGWSGAVQAAGEAPTWDAGQSKSFTWM